MKQFLLIPGDFSRIRELRSLSGFVLLELLHCDLRGDGLVWPSQALIAKRLSSSRAQVTRALTRLEAHGFIVRTKRGRSSAYQIAERFLVDSLLRRPARSAKPGQREQRELLLPISGVQTTPVEAPIGVQPTPIERPKIGVDPTPHGVRLTPGRRRKEQESNPASSIESTAAREGKKNIEEVSPARSARPGSDADKARAREGWLSWLGEYVRDVKPDEVGRFWENALASTEPDAHRYLNALTREAKGTSWWRERQGAIAQRHTMRPGHSKGCAAGAPRRRSERRRPKRRARA